MADTHAPYVYEHHGARLGLQFRAECPCGWVGVTWFSRVNAEGDVLRHRERPAADAPTP